MEPRTETVGTKNWLEASKGLKVRAYIESCVSTWNVHERPLPNRDFYDDLRKVSVSVSNEGILRQGTPGDKEQ